MTETELTELIGFADTTLPGTLYTERSRLSHFATDKGMYRIQPAAAYQVHGEHDLSLLVQFAADHKLPIIPRAGGSNTGGTAIGNGIVILTDKARGLAHINGPVKRAGDFDVTVGAAVRHDKLQAHLRKHGRYLPSDPSSGPLSYVGGNVATKASGPHALRHGAIDRYIRTLRYVAASGKIVNTAALDREEQKLVQELRRELEGLPEACRFLEARRSVKSASGYNVGALLEESEPGEALAKLFAGSLGTLGIVTEVTLATEAFSGEKRGLLLYFRSLAEAASYAAESLRHGPSAIEIVNRSCLDLVSMRHPDIDIPHGAQSMLIYEFDGPHPDDAARAVKEEADSAIRTIGAATSDEIDALWTVRKRLALELQHYKKGYRALALVNDIGVPVQSLASFIREAEAIFARRNIIAPIYGHAGDGNLHLRPLFDMSRPDLKELLAEIADEVYSLVLRHGGTITGEHGVGRQRARYLERELPAELFSFMRRLKDRFDPHAILNPDAMFESQGVADNLNFE